MSKYYDSFENAKDVTAASHKLAPTDATSPSFLPSPITGTPVINVPGLTPFETAGAGTVGFENIPISGSESEQMIKYLSQKKVIIRDYKLKK